MQIQGSHTNRSEPAGGGWHHVYSGSTDVEGHAPWHWSMVIFFTDDGLSFFQLSSLPGCWPRAGERLRGEAGWSHRWGQQGAAGAFRASCQRLRLPFCSAGMVRQSHVGPGSWLCEVPQLWSRTAEVWWKEGWQSWSGCPLSGVDVRWKEDST